MNKMYRSIWNAATETHVAVAETTKTRGRRCSSAVMAAGVVVALSGAPGTAQAAIVTACTGVSLPASAVTGILTPIVNVLDPLGILGLGPTLTNIAANGAPVNLNVLDANGNVVSPADCPTTYFGVIPPKGISIGGNQISGLGDVTPANAGEINSIAFGNGAVTYSTTANANSIAIGPNASVGVNGTTAGANSVALGSAASVTANNSMALGSTASVTAANSVALGNASSVTAANSVALGSGSTAITGAQANYPAFGLTALQNSAGEVSVGSAGNERQITNVAAGSTATDAVNVAQLTAVDNGAVKYDRDVNGLVLKTSITLEGVGGTTIKNLAPGVAPTDAVNKSQLDAIGPGISLNLDALGNSMAANLGGGATYDSTTHVVSAPTYPVYGVNQTNVGAAIDALQTQAPLQYSDAAGVPIPNTTTLPSLNDVTLVGPVAGPVTLHNVANGVAPNDAVNKGQLDAVQTNVTNLDALAVKYDDATKAKVTLGGAAGTTITNVAPGALNATSTDAVNGSQLYTTNVRIDNLTTGTTKYFHANSVKADSLAVGTDSIAVGPAAIANGAGSVAIGDNSQTAIAATGAVAIGQNSRSNGVNSIAIGTGAVASGSIAVGAGAQAGLGGAAFGDNAIATTVSQGVALGTGSQATRAGMNGTAEKYSNTVVTSTNGAVSVGSVGAERQITNVAGGTQATDAVNVRQLDAAVALSNQGINNQIIGLQNDIATVRRDANAGSASAMAAANMPQPSFPGKSMVAAGLATYEGQSALAVGVSNLSDNGRWVFKFSGSTNTRGNVGAGVGVGFHF